MSLKTILQRVQSDAGATSVELNTAQREWLITKINEAAEEIYEECPDLPLALKECFIKPTNGYRIACPPFVGELRAVRSQRYNDLWKLSDIRARYNSVDWPEKWNKARLLSIEPIAIELTDSAPGTIEVAVADPTLTVSLTGETTTSNNDSEVITCSSTSNAWTKSFTSFRSIIKNKITRQNVVVKDTNGTEMAVIYADQFESRYQVFDVSLYPTIQDCTDGTFIMEVLYKPRLPYLYYDDDVFPVPDFDNVVVLKTKQLLAEGEEGKEQRAILMHQKGERKLKKKVENRVGTVEKKLSFQRNPLMGIFRRYRC